MATKIYQAYSVIDAARSRISKSFDEFEKVYISFSGGKDSTVMMHLALDEAKKRNRKVGILIIDLEAQYADTITHLNAMVEMYKENIDLQVDVAKEKKWKRFWRSVSGVMTGVAIVEGVIIYSTLK